MKYGLQQTVPPAGEPVSLAEVKTWLRVDSDDTTQDDTIAGLITQAREYCEAFLDRQFLTATYVLSLENFYGRNLPERPGVQLYGAYRSYGEAWKAWQERGGGWGTYDISVIRLPRPPLQAVTAVTYVDQTGVTQTLSPSVYQVDTQQEPGRLAPAYQQVWPTTRVQMGAVQVTFLAGYGPATSVTVSISTGVQVVTPASMTGIYVGTLLDVDIGQNRERVAVTAVTGSTFTSTFAKSHTGPVAVQGALPEAVRSAIRLLVGFDYANREATAAELDRVHDLLTKSWPGEY